MKATQTNRGKGQSNGRKHQENKIQTEICPYAKKCGGCTLQGVPYKEQLRLKEKEVKKLFAGICDTAPIVGMDHPKHYRNKVHAVLKRKRDGSIVSGVYEAGTHHVVPVDSCMIEDEKADAIIRDIRDLCCSFKIKIYSEDSGYGLLRHILVRRGFASGEIMVVLVASSPVFPSKNNFVKALRNLHPEITTIVLNINDKQTSMVLGERDIVMYGKGYIVDSLCGCQFKISPQSFYQVNPVQTEKLYAKAIELADLKGKERILDAYCGIGTIGLIASKNAKEVIGVELNREAVKDAIANAKLNQNKKVRFFVGDAGEFMLSFASAGEKVDVVFLDPPRAGSDEKFLSSVAVLHPEKVVYISCNPETMVRDILFLQEKGYKPGRVYLYDLFPFCGHVEAVVMLSYKKTDSVINVKVEFGEGEGKVPLDNIVWRAEAYKPKERVTYKMIKEYIEAKYGFKVHTAYIAEVKRELGLPMYDAPNVAEELKQPRKYLTAKKMEAIKDTLKHFDLISCEIAKERNGLCDAKFW